MPESNRARQAFEDYYALGPGRSLAALLDRYRIQTESGPRPPSARLASLKLWSSRFGWQARVAARDAEISAAAQAALEAERTAVLSKGFAQMHKRVETLNELAGKLLTEINRPAAGDPDRGGLWAHDVKQIGTGELAERVDLFRFQAALIEQFRGALSDLADELGERKKGLELSGPGGAPIAIREVIVEVPATQDSDA